MQQVVTGAKSVLPSLRDPAKLMEYATLLLTEGALRDVNLLEYWGENPATQRRLRPVIEAVLAMLDKAAAESDASKAEVEKKMTNANDRAAADRWMKLEELAQTARFTRHMAAYYLALALPRDKPGMAERAKVADGAAEFLKEFDVEDSNVQAAVRNRVAKLLMAKGDYAAAEDVFQTVIAGKGIKPPPTPTEQYEARYFAAVSELEAGNVDGARKALTELVNWQQANLPRDDTTQKGVAAAAEMLQYRIHQSVADAAKAKGDAGSAEKANAAAVEVLTKLSNDRPDLRPIISEQLVERVDITRGVEKLDPLLLRALVQKGVGERDKGEGEKADPEVLKRAIAAAQEIARRRGQSGVDEQLAQSAELLVPSFLEKMGRKVEAAEAYLAFLDQHKEKTSQTDTAFNAAGTLIVMDLRRGSDKGNKEVVAVWERFLPLAIERFGRLGLAYDYADRLRANKKYKEAAAYYARVPQNDPRYLSAKYLQMISLTSLLDQTQGPATQPAQPPAQGSDAKPAPQGPQYVVQGEERQRLAGEIQKLAEQVRKMATDAMASAKDDAERARHQLKAAGATLTMADLAATELQDPKRTLAVLADFEKEVAGLPGAQDMLNRVLFLRVNSLMASGQLEQATKTLVGLLEKSGGQEGQEIVFSLLSRLNDEFDKAEAAGNEQAMRTIAQNRARLSGFLVEWARGNKNPDIAKRVYSYSVYDAESKRLAGTLAKDKKLLGDALAAFKRLLTPEMTALYRKEVAGTRIDPEYPHVNVLLGVGLVNFELGDYEGSRDALGRLLVDRKLGTPKVEKIDERTNETRYEDNQPYWEAWYKLLRSNVEIHRKKPNDPVAQQGFQNAKDGLKRLYIIGDVGGEKWADEFEALRKELIPDFNPKPDPPPAEPVAAGASKT